MEITRIGEKYKVVGEYREGGRYFLWEKNLEEFKEELAEVIFISH